jgi:phenylacetate-CoA ligase
MERGSPAAERLSPEDMKKLQEQRLRSMVANAYANSLFWHDWFDSAGLRPGDINTLEDLAKIPQCTKKDLLARPERDRLTQDPEKCNRGSTSGSTGGPLAVFNSKRFTDHLFTMILFRFTRMTGFKMGRKMMTIAYALPSKEPDDPTKPTRSSSRKVFGVAVYFLRPISRFIYRTVYIGYGIDDIAPEISDYKPRLVYGTPTYLRLLADWVRSTGNKNARPKENFLTGEPLDEPTREYIDATFGSRTLNGYGANEFGFMAVECREKSGMHIQSDSVILEVMCDGRPALPGEPGELVITGLVNDAMPLIRYNIGDVGVLSDARCTCGRTLPLLASVEGRVVDHIRLSSGRIISPKKVMTMMHTIPDLPRSQLVQETPDTFTLRVFADTPAARAATTEFLRQLKAEIGGESTVNVTFETPDRLRAKFRPVISKLDPPAAGKWLKPLRNAS